MAEDPLEAALREIWTTSRPLLKQRVTTLEDVTAAAAAHTLDAALRTEGQSAAHKLAGSLGTFGLLRAGELAKQAECLLQGTSDLTESEILRLAAITASVGTAISSGVDVGEDGVAGAPPPPAAPPG